MFEKFQGLGQALQVPNQDLAGLNRVPALAHLKAVFQGRRTVRFGFDGSALTVHVGVEANLAGTCFFLLYSVFPLR
jgi:hypothetical protein